MSKKPLIVLYALLIGTMLLSGCTSQKTNVFAQEKASPDEFAVYSRAPLSLPPDFGLRPPRPGVTRPQTVMPRNEAKKALLKSSNPSTTPKSNKIREKILVDETPGITALLNNAGVSNANPNIRALVNSETDALSNGEEGAIIDNILFWRKGDAGLKGAIIDPAVENRRMRRKNAEGIAVDETPDVTKRQDEISIEREIEKGFWGRLFD